MADIAFLLLVFFLVTTTIDTDKGLSLVLPAKGEEVEIATKNIANLLINKDGLILFEDEMVALSDLRRIASNKLKQNDKLIISIKTDRETKYQVYIDVLDALKLAKATRISIAEPEY